jgi:acyl-CoA thioester hydrolase
MEQEATYRCTVYPWQCEISGVHMDRELRKSAPFADAIRQTALRHRTERAEA